MCIRLGTYAKALHSFFQFFLKTEKVEEVYALANCLIVGTQSSEQKLRANILV